jgi:ferredoxin
MRVKVDEELCTGHGRCYALAPDVYAPDDRGHCLILVEDVPPELEAAARSGEANCPERAITIEE